MNEPKNNHHSVLALTSLRLCAVLGLLYPCLVSSQDDSLTLGDFSHTNAVTILLGTPGRGREIGEHGLRHPTRAGGDAQTTFLTVQGVPCRCLEPTEQRFSKSYFPFIIDPTFKSEEASNVRIDVEYFDGFEGHAGVFGLQYDATGVWNGFDPACKQYYPNVALKGSQKWLKATFHVKDATFQNSQNNRADFRLWASPPELCVSRVTVTLEHLQQAPKETPLPFNGAGEAKLEEWNLQWDAGSKPFYASNTSSVKEGRWLEVRAPGTFGKGSWRTTALLEAGVYQFVGKARTQGLEGEPGGQASGICLRMSYRSEAKVVPSAPDWTMLTYDFTVPALTYVELICEVRGSQGSVRFDLDSLKLIRKSKSGS